MSERRANRGYTLLETLIGVFLSAVLMISIIQLLSGSTAAYRLLIEQSQLEASGRYLRNTLSSHIQQAGFHPEPWSSSPPLAAISMDSLDEFSTKGDQVSLQQLSQLNCYGNENPARNSDGDPKFYLMQTRFRINAGNNLAMTCRYGPDPASLVTQINNFGLVEGVENLQVLYAEDQNGDAIADHWVPAGAWGNEQNITAIKIAVLLSTRQSYGHKSSVLYTLLETSIEPPADGRLRRVINLTSAIYGRVPAVGISL